MPDMSRNAAGWPQPVFFYCILAYAALLLLPSYAPVLPGLDQSWQFALNHFVHTQFKFGPDLIFTYGPLGFVEVPQHSNLMVTVGIRAPVWLVLVWQLVAFWRSGRHFAAVVLTLGLIATSKIFGFSYLVQATMLVVLVRMLLAQIDYSGLALLAILMALAFLLKFTTFVMSAACLAVYSASLARGGQRASRPWGIAATGAVFLAGPVAYFVYNPSFRGLFLYFKGAFQIASGYAAAMSVPTDSLNAKLGFIVCTMLGGSVVYALWRRLVTVRGAGIVLVAAWVTFRHGYVRSDTPHVALFFAFVIFLFSVLLAQMDFRQRDTKILTAVFVVFTGVAMVGVAEYWQPQSWDWWSPKANVSAALDLLHWKHATNQLDHIADSALTATVGPMYGAAVNGKQVLVFPWDVAYAAHGQFQVVPFYTIQAYSAYTRYLDRMSAEKILAVRPPLDNIIFEWKGLDDRNPVLDVPAVWSTLLANFVPEMRKDDSLLLAPRSTPLRFMYTPLSAAEYKPGSWVSVPQATTPVAMSIDLRPTVFGAALTSAYKQEPVFLDVKTASGNRARFRVPTDVLSSPTLINVLPLSFDDAAALWTANTVKDPIVAFRLLGDGLAHMRADQYSFYRVEGTAIVVAEQQSFPVSTLQTRFHISSTAEIRNLLSGNFDGIDGKQIAHLNDPKLAIRVNAAIGCVIEGWLASSDLATAKSMDEVYAVVNGLLVKAQIVLRTDVGESLKNPALNNSGYRLYLESPVLHPGVQGIDLVGLTRENGKLYRFPGTLYLEGE